MLKGKKSQDDPPNPSRWTGGPGGQQDQGHGIVLHDQGEEYQQPITSKSGSSLDLVSLTYPNPVLNRT